MDLEIVYALRDLLIFMVLSYPFYMMIISVTSRMDLTIAMVLIKLCLFLSYASIIGGGTWLIEDTSNLSNEGRLLHLSADIVVPYFIFAAVVMRKIKRDYQRLIDSGTQTPINILARRQSRYYIPTKRGPVRLDIVTYNFDVSGRIYKATRRIVRNGGLLQEGDRPLKTVLYDPADPLNNLPMSV